MSDTMNINAMRGDKVIFTAEGGYDSDIARAKTYLKPGVEYTVDYTKISGWSTAVFLVEFPGTAFNSVMFEDA